MLSPAPPSPGERWPPLESSPDVFNQFMWSLGVPRGEAELHDVYGLDAEALAMVPQPVGAVIFCFPDHPPQNLSNPPEQAMATEEKETRDKVYFIKTDYCVRHVPVDRGKHGATMVHGLN